MSNTRVKRNSGATTVIKDGRIVGNLPGPNANAPSPEDEAVALLSGLEGEQESGTDLAVLHDLYAAKASVRTDGDFLAPTTEIPSSLAGTSTDIPKDLHRVASGVLATFGVKDPRQREQFLSDAIQALGLHRDTRILDPDEAATEVSLAMNATDGNKGDDKLLAAIRSREIALTKSEITVLHGIRDDLLAERAQSESLAVPFDDEGVWTPPYLNRQCTICGKFVGELGSHDGCTNRRDLYSLFDLNGGRPKGVKIPVILDEKTGETEIKMSVPALAKYHRDLSIEEQQDAYMSSARTAPLHYLNDQDAWVASAIIGQYIKKSPLGKATLPLPKELRDAYLASKVRYPSPQVVAELIDPPFTPGELEHLVESDNSENLSGVRGLFASPRAGSDVLRILENSPSDTGRRLAELGFLPVKTIRNMASSGDSLIRRQAARARDIPAEEADRLSTDPDPDVRSEILRRVKDFPETLDNFVNDPDPDLALRAIKAYPGERGAIVAIGKITSRKRLQTIHDSLPDLWGENAHSANQETIETVQEWIRTRLGQ